MGKEYNNNQDNIEKDGTVEKRQIPYTLSDYNRAGGRPFRSRWFYEDHKI